MNTIKAKKRQQIFALSRSGHSVREISKRAHVSRQTVLRYVNSVKVSKVSKNPVEVRLYIKLKKLKKLIRAANLLLQGM